MLRHTLLEQLGWRGSPGPPAALAAAFRCFSLSPEPEDFRLKSLLCFSQPQHSLVFPAARGDGLWCGVKGVDFCIKVSVNFENTLLIWQF